MLDEKTAELTEKLKQIIDLADISLNLIRDIYDTIPPFDSSQSI